MVNYFGAVDHRRLMAEFPLGDGFLEGFRRLSRDELFHRQDRRFRRVMRRAWQIPFYARRYRAAGLEPRDIRGIEEIARLPSFSKSDLMDSIARHPPFGDFHGIETMRGAGRGAPVILHTTSGTTGDPQVLLFGPKSREVQNLLLARAYLFQGLRDQDVIHSVYGFGMINGGHYIREAVLHWTGAILLPAGAGNETPSQQQVWLMRDFGATVIVGFADYIRRLAIIARDSGIIPGRDIRPRLIIGHLGREDRAALSELWGGPELFDWYGVGDTGLIAAEGPDHSGLYVMEDAHYLEMIDVDSGDLAGDGAPGDMVVTALFKDDIYPIIRFNTHDVSAFATDGSPLGLKLRRIRGFLGRSDNMVKIRGINIFPQAIGPLLAEIEAFTGEFICRATRDQSGRDEFAVVVELRGEAAARPRLARRLGEILRQKLGIDVAIETVAPGELAPLTGIESRQKPIRLIDRRF